ncbi:MAG: hypothetical protein WD181_04675 [Solirubrobacterales bacterium]
MSDPNRSGRRPADTLPPGADRFWGQFSQTKAGRTRSREEPPAPDPDGPPEDSQHCLEWCPICRSADIVRATTSPEAIGQVQAIQNEAIGVLKTFLAIYAERTGQSPPGKREGSGDDSGEEARRGGRDESSNGDGGPAVRDISIE